MASTATSIAAPFVTGDIAQLKKYSLRTDKLKHLDGFPSQVSVPQNSKLIKHRLIWLSMLSTGLVSCPRQLTLDGTGGGSGDFVAGSFIEGAIFGTLTYAFAPQMRRLLLNEDEYGFRKARRPIYIDKGFEKTRQKLNAMTSLLNNAIDNVSSRLIGGYNVVANPVKSDPEAVYEDII